jgi:hypothetical protein
MTIHEILTEWSYRLDRGYPEMDNPYDILVLEKILKESGFDSKDVNATIQNLQENLFGPKEEKEKTTSQTDNEDEIGQLRTQLGSHSKKDIIDLVNELDIDEKEIQKLYHRVAVFTTYKPILQSLGTSNYKDIVIKRYSSEIQSIIEDLSPKDNAQFVNYLSNPEEQLDFPTNNTGNLKTIIPSDKIPTSVMSKIMTHATQDEGRKGVGMGELGLALIFKNVTDSKGKGDLALNGEEFEIKGDPATLGEKPEKLEDIINTKMNSYGIEVESGGSGKINYCIGEKCLKSELAIALAATYDNTEDKEGFKSTIKDILANDAKLGTEAVDALFDNIDFSSAESYQKEIPLMNLYRYVAKEDFKHFLAHDFGAGAANTGKYVYAGGTPQEIVDGIRKTDVKFQKLSPNNLRPRIGFQETGMLEED